jgi:hypothetical protein
MLLATSSAGVIVHSLPQTKFAVTGRYQVRPAVQKKNISTQQSTWIERWKMAVLEDADFLLVGCQFCQ